MTRSTLLTIPDLRTQRGFKNTTSGLGDTLSQTSILETLYKSKSTPVLLLREHYPNHVNILLYRLSKEKVSFMYFSFGVLVYHSLTDRCSVPFSRVVLVWYERGLVLKDRRSQHKFNRSNTIKQYYRIQLLLKYLRFCTKSRGHLNFRLFFYTLLCSVLSGVYNVFKSLLY